MTNFPLTTRRAVRDKAFAVTADELRQFIERFEQLEAEKKDIAEQQKELMREGAKVRLAMRQEAARQRREKVLAMRTAGMTIPQMARELGAVTHQILSTGKNFPGRSPEC